MKAMPTGPIRVSEAILKLKEHYNAGQLVVMGHSGGANILANGLGYNEVFKPDTSPYSYILGIIYTR